MRNGGGRFRDIRFKETSDLQECGTNCLSPKLSYDTPEKFLKVAEVRKPFLKFLCLWIYRCTYGFGTRFQVHFC